MNLPRKHHYKPVFFLKQWTGKDQKLCEMKLVNGKVVAHRRHPKATGFHNDLYHTAGVPEANLQNLETKFMTPLDTVAARALNKIISGIDMDGEERVAWARSCSRCSTGIVNASNSSSRTWPTCGAKQPPP